MIMLYRYHLKARYRKPGEKYRHFTYPDISLIWYGSAQPVDKGIRIIEVALYNQYVLLNNDHQTIADTLAKIHVGNLIILFV